MAIGREPKQQNDEMIREADVDDPKQVSLLDLNDQPEENVNEVAGEHEENKNVRCSNRARLRNPRYNNDGVVNATMSDNDLPKMLWCNQPRRATEEDVVTNAFEYVFIQYGLVRGLKNGSQGKGNRKGADPDS